MSTHGKERKDLNVYLYFYTKDVYFREKKNFDTEEMLWIEISAEKLGTMGPLKIKIERGKSGFYIYGDKETSGNFAFLKTEDGQTVFLVIAEGKEKLGLCSRIQMQYDAVVVVGSSYLSDIFYEYETFISERMFTIEKSGNRFRLCGMSLDKGRKESGAVYVNGEAIDEDITLQVGDTIVLQGLSILLLHDMLLCTCFYGTMRVARSITVTTINKCNLRGEQRREDLESVMATDRNLHMGEVEVERPQAEIKQTNHPFVLTMGPTATMILPVLLMTYVGTKVSGNTGYYQVTIWMTIASVILSTFWTSVNYIYRKMITRKEERERRNSYKEYLNRLKEYMEVCMKENRETMLLQYPSYQFFLGDEGRGKVLWSKGYERSSTCFIRLGLGESLFQISVKMPGGKQELCTDDLLKDAYQLSETYRYIEDVPVGIDLMEAGNVSYVGENVYTVVMQSVIQLIARHDGRNMKIAFFYNDECRQEQNMAQCFKWLPHVWNAEKNIRFLAGNEAEADEIISYLSKKFGNETEEDVKVKYVIIASNEKLVRAGSIDKISKMSVDKSEVRTIYIGKKRESIPVECSHVVDVDRERICWQEDGKIMEQSLRPEVCVATQADTYMRKMACKETGSMGGEKWNNQLSFLELYGCEKVEELNCSLRWRENRTKNKIRVPIGKEKGDKLICLDIHEKAHGPHGLVAGTTGSGKSELLQTYLLSLAVSFSPEDINFFIIDYKGGGMGDALKKLPHCSGVISNLSGRQIRRALAAIKSENTRRQMCFHKAGVSHIEEYAELYKAGIKEEPIPHLLIVVDEFAELKKEEPEFMKEIISVSQVGRSLGIHLILATQKPAGTVDDKIWSNTRFRLCLRVADKQDSHDMLHRSDAAYLTVAGRGYMQVGNNELFTEFQTGYSKALYLPIRQRGETAFVTNTGSRIKLLDKEMEKKQRQLECIVAYINETFVKNVYKSAEMLWMPELSKQVVLSDGSLDSCGEICLGICDHVRERKQLPVYYNPVRDGHLCLCGGPASGKSTFLQTVLWQLCNGNNTDEAQFLLIASDYAGLNCFENMPHCIGIMKSAEEAECFFYHLKSLFYQRKHLLEGINYVQYQRKQSKKIPQVYIVIDGYGNFRELTQDAYAWMIEKIASEGLNYGIYLVITASAVGNTEVPIKLFEKIKTTVALAVTESTTYGDVLRRYQISIFPAQDCKGRGLCKFGDEILEFQVPLIAEEDDYERIQRIEERARMLSEKESAAQKFPKLPKVPKFEVLYKQFKKEQEGKENRIPIGYHKQSANVEVFPFSKLPFVITGVAGSGKKMLLSIMMKALHKQGIPVYLYDTEEQMEKYDVGFATAVTKEKLEGGELWKQKNAVLAIGNLTNFVKEIPFYHVSFPIIAINHTEEEMKVIGNPWFEEITKNQCGICLGTIPGNQKTLSFDDLGYEQMCKKVPPGYGYLKSGTGEATKQIYLVREG